LEVVEEVEVVEVEVVELMLSAAHSCLFELNRKSLHYIF
jgi:hypothetical protein